MSNWVCPIHGSVRWVKPGVSKKTNQPYPGFFVCGEKGCEERPPKEADMARQPARQAPPQQRPVPQKPAPDWDRIAAGKVRCAMWCAWASGTRPWNEYWESFDDGFRHIMSGSVPGFDERELNERWEDIPPDDVPAF